MENDTSGARASTQARTQQACKRCRSLKARCLLSNQPGICQRCLNSKRDCVWPQSQQRTRLPRGPSRISQVEKKIDGLVARIVDKNAFNGKNSSVSPGKSCEDSSVHRDANERGHASPRSTPSRAGTESVTEQEQSASHLRTITDIHLFGTDVGAHDSQQASSTSHHGSSLNDELANSLLSISNAEDLVDQYRPMSASFPFVPVDVQVTAEELAKRKPMLLLALMTVASWKEPRFQRTLEDRFKHEVMQRTMIQPHKTLELLQGILVYLAWHHYFVDPKLQNTAMMPLAIGLTADLRLDHRSIPRLLPSRDPVKRVRHGKEGQRALLGCYYLCSLTSCALRTPNLFNASRHMLESCMKLDRECSLASDRLLSSLIQVRFFDDQIYEFLHPSSVYRSLPDKEEILSQWQIWQSRLLELHELSKEQQESHLLGLSLHGASMELNHSIYRHMHRGECTPNQAALGLTETKLLSACLEAGRSYLDTLISVPIEDFHLLGWPVWLRLPRVLIVIAMLTSPSEQHSSAWDVKRARDRVRLDLFIESLCFRMQNLTTYKPPTQPSLDFWLTMKTVLESVSRWYKNSSRPTTGLVTRSATSQSTPQIESWDIDSTIADSHGISTQSQTSELFAFTPESTVSASYAQPDLHWNLQSQISSIGCPMMKANTGFDMDQFMEAGFWGDAFLDFDTFEASFPTI